MELYVLVQMNSNKLSFWRGNGEPGARSARRNIRAFPTLGLAESALNVNHAPENVFIALFKDGIILG